jgi:hypothetical protein
VGIFKLEGTPNAVDAKTAAALLPLWRRLKNLNNNAAAQSEIDAIVAQIKSAMTPDQNQAIANMKIAQWDIATLRSQINNPGGATTTGTPSDATPSNRDTGGSQTANPEKMATLQAQRTLRADNMRLPAGLLNALIQLLQDRAGVTPAGTIAATP